MISGFPPKGNRDIAAVLPALKIDKEKNVIIIKFKTLPVTKTAAGAAAKTATPGATAAATALDSDKTYHAYLGIQAGGTVGSSGILSATQTTEAIQKNLKTVSSIRKTP